MTNAIARRLEAIQTKGAMRSSDVANVLNVRPETVSRWNKGRALPHASTEKQLLELEFVIDKLADIYEPHDARLWLFARQRLLQDQVPAELIQQGRVDEVLASVNSCLTARIFDVDDMRPGRQDDSRPRLAGPAGCTPEGDL